MGARDLESGTVELARRDNLTKETVPVDGVEDLIENLLVEIQNSIFQKSLDFRAEKTTKVDSYDEFKELLETKTGFFLAHWDGTDETEEKIKNETKATIRCIPFDNEQEEGVCMVTGKPSRERVVFAKSY
jgi:prolyl-tRNA synthetase